MQTRHERDGKGWRLTIQGRLLLAFLALSTLALAMAALFATQFVTVHYLHHLLLQQVDPAHMRGPLGPAMERVMARLNGPERVLLTRIHYGILQAGALAMVFSVLLSYLLARRITRPVAAMHAAAESIARGDFSQRVPVSGTDELADLGRALNYLARSLEDADRLRRHMVADLAHELRTPITALRSYAEALKDGVLEPDAETLGALLAETVRLERLVEDLRELSLLDANALPIAARPMDLRAVIGQVVALRQSEAGAKGVRIEADLPADLPEVRADPDRVAQILQNLLANALTHTPPGGRITVAAAKAADGPSRGGLVRVTVADTGPGIPSEDLPYIFERFYRADQSRSRATGGTGLGLTIARKLVEAQGGAIQAENRPGGGAAFTFTLPAA